MPNFFIRLLCNARILARSIGASIYFLIVQQKRSYKKSEDVPHNFKSAVGYFLLSTVVLNDGMLRELTYLDKNIGTTAK